MDKLKAIINEEQQQVKKDKETLLELMDHRPEEKELIEFYTGRINAAVDIIEKLERIV